MRIVNLANRMDYLAESRWGADSQGLRGQAYTGLVKIQKKSQGDKPSGSGSQVFTHALGPLQRIEMERFARTLLEAPLH